MLSALDVGEVAAAPIMCLQQLMATKVIDSLFSVTISLFLFLIFPLENNNNLIPDFLKAKFVYFYLGKCSYKSQLHGAGTQLCPHEQHHGYHLAWYGIALK